MNTMGMKRMLSVVLAFVMIMSLLVGLTPVTASAATIVENMDLTVKNIGDNGFKVEGVNLDENWKYIDINTFVDTMNAAHETNAKVSDFKAELKDAFGEYYQNTWPKDQGWDVLEDFADSPYYEYMNEPYLEERVLLIVKVSGETDYEYEFSEVAWVELPATYQGTAKSTLGLAAVPDAGEETILKVNIDKEKLATIIKDGQLIQPKNDEEYNNIFDVLVEAITTPDGSPYMMHIDPLGSGSASLIDIDKNDPTALDGEYIYPTDGPGSSNTYEDLDPDKDYAFHFIVFATAPWADEVKTDQEGVYFVKDEYSNDMGVFVIDLEKVMEEPAAAPEEGTLDVDAKVDKEAPIQDVTVANKEAELLAGKIFTDAEKTAIENGEDSKVWLEVDKVDVNALSKENKTKFEEAAKKAVGSDANIIYFEADLYKQVGNGNPEEVSEPGVAIEITFKVPSDLLNKDKAVERTYKVLRLHDGEVEAIDGKFNAETGEFTFKTDKFSTYAIVYKDAPKAENPKTGDTNSVLPMVALMAVAGAAMVVTNKKRKEEK